MAALPDSLARSVKEQIRDKIDPLSSIYKCYTFDKIPLEGSPTAIVNYGSMEGEFWSTNENERVYAYNVKILVQIGNTPQDVTNDRLQQAEEETAKAVEDVLNALDSDFELGQYNSEVIFLDALDVLYSTYEYEGGFAKGAEMTVRVHTYHQV